MKQNIIKEHLLKLPTVFAWLLCARQYTETFLQVIPFDTQNNVFSFLKFTHHKLTILNCTVQLFFVYSQGYATII